MAASPASELLDAFTAEVRRAAHSLSHEQVHNLRVAIRKLTQALAVVDAPPKHIGQIRHRLKIIMRFAGKTRDYDIAIRLAQKVQASRRFLSRLRRRRAEAAKALALDVQKWLDLNTSARWHATLGTAHPSSSADRVLLKAVKRLFKRGESAEDSNKKLHPLRIAAKKLRYTLDLLDTPDAAHLEQIKELQKRLGDINDYETARRIAAEELAGKRVIARLGEKQDKKVRSFRRYWEREFSGKKHRQEWRKVTLQAAPSRSRAHERQGAA